MMARKKMNSMVRQVRHSVSTIALLMTIPVILGLVATLFYSARYQAMIRRMDRAVELKPMVETTLAENMFSVTAGRIPFAESGAEDLIYRVNETLDRLLEETGGSGHLQLTVARRTMDTLEQYILKIRDGMEENLPIDRMEQIVDEIRNVGRLVAAMIDAFISEEITDASNASVRLGQVVLAIAGAEAILLIFGLIYTRVAMNRLTGDIQTALSSLESTVRQITEGDLGSPLPDVEVEELQELGEHINLMAKRLEELIAETGRNQEHLAKAELRTLQAQINPHFLYNTLDAILWKAEAGEREDIIQLTLALSNFFRISLSSGADWIPISQEKKHIAGYLSIQQMRYRDILKYDIDIPDEIGEYYILKLLLQPLVENALYHGIKIRRGGGVIRVAGRLEGGWLHFSVRDTGVGMTPEQLEQLQARMQQGQPAVSEGNGGFGLVNVNLRLRLYYHLPDGLQIVSGPEGTEVSFRVPCRTREEIMEQEGTLPGENGHKAQNRGGTYGT